VSLDEVVSGVAIALGTSPMNSCERFDSDQSGNVEVPELLMGVDASLNGCAP
jgi:hypothetical protein